MYVSESTTEQVQLNSTQDLIVGNASGNNTNFVRMLKYYIHVTYITIHVYLAVISLPGEVENL